MVQKYTVLEVHVLEKGHKAEYEAQYLGQGNISTSLQVCGLETP